MGQTRANNAIVPLGNGAIEVLNDAPGAVHLIVDVSGYFDGGGSSSRLRRGSSVQSRLASRPARSATR